jgi:ATP-binding cassette subfamily C protein EexD
MAPQNSKTNFKDMEDALEDTKRYFLLAALFSAAVNFLMLTPVIYMLQVYDRVISSGSYSTLTMLTLLMTGLLAASGGFEWVRSMILISASNRIEKKLRKRLSDATFKRALLTAGVISNQQPLSDLTQLRQFLTGNGMFALFDAPWFPIYIAVMFLFHPWFGFAGIFAGCVMVCLAYLTEKATGDRLKEANAQALVAQQAASETLQNAEVIAAMGMAEVLQEQQESDFDNVIKLQSSASTKASLFTSVTKTFRLVMQSLLLGLGALLALNQEISPGMMIAGSLLLGRALAPIDMLVGSWKGFITARGQYERIGTLLSAIPIPKKGMALPRATGHLSVEQISVAPPASQKIVVAGVTFNIAPGEILAIVGPSASGKSCLARAILGIWPTNGGKVRLDNADISQWDRTDLGPQIGYLPQDIELFNGTIAQNICRFGSENADQIVSAAKCAGVHDMILQLPQGYDTRINAGNAGALSGGQRQRIGLARAAYGNPKLILLDEPNSNLDDSGERELIQALEKFREMQSTTIVITHRTKLLKIVDKILVMRQGTAQYFGPRKQVLEALGGSSSNQDQAASS